MFATAFTVVPFAFPFRLAWSEMLRADSDCDSVCSCLDARTMLKRGSSCRSSKNSDGERTLLTGNEWRAHVRRASMW